MFRIRVVSGLAVLLIAAQAAAGIVDTPVPEVLPGVTTYHVYTVPGIIDSPQLETYFSCTSTDTTAMQVGVEIFGTLGGSPGNDAVATSVSLVPGGTVLVGTGAAAWVGIHSNVGGSVGTGSARILATSKKLACTAYLADPANVSPTSMTYLTIIAKTKQKAAN